MGGRRGCWLVPPHVRRAGCGYGCEGCLRGSAAFRGCLNGLSGRLDVLFRRPGAVWAVSMVYDVVPENSGCRRGKGAM